MMNSPDFFRFRALIILVAVLFITVFGSTPASALPTNSKEIYYYVYDGGQNCDDFEIEVGYWIRTCSGAISSGGVTGDRKMEIVTDCNTGQYTITYWMKCGATWAQLYPPSFACPC